MKPRVAAIIANFNGGDTVAEAVASVLDQVDRVVVVDDGSTDGSTDRAERRFGDRIRVVRMGSNTGVSRSRNAGAAAMPAEILLFLDCDAVAADGMVATLCDALTRDPKLGIVAPVVLDARADDIVQCYDATIDRWGFTFDRACGKTLDELSPEPLRDAFYVSGCSLAIRSEVFNAIGGFDEGIFFGCEDVDICWRARLAGYGVASVRSATCRHRGASSLGVDLEGSLYTPGLRAGGYKTSAFRVTVRELNTFRMMVANLDARNLALYLALYPPTIAAEMIGLALIGRRRVSTAYLHALRAMFAAIPGAFARRKIVQALRRVPDAAITRFWSRGYLKLRFLRRNGVPQALCFALAAGALTSVLNGCGGGASPGIVAVSPHHSATAQDWNTFGDGLEREGEDTSDVGLSSANVPRLAMAWSRNVGGAIDAQILFAAGLSVAGAKHDVLYVGTESGAFYALDAESGAVLWERQLAATTRSCEDLPHGSFGITATATFDRSTNRIYVADGDDEVYALDMSTGAVEAGWPVDVTTETDQEHVYSALTYNPANNMLYAATAGYCDVTPYRARLVAINTQSANVVDTFLPEGNDDDGGGIWGMGGVSIDPQTNDVFVGVGNTEGDTAHDAYGESVVQLTPSLGVVASNYPGLPSGDFDFGSTPMLYAAQGCPEQLVAQNKAGYLYVYDVDSIGAGPVQTLQMDSGSGGQFIGVATFSSSTNDVYVGDPSGYGVYTHGLVALHEQANCTLAPAWQFAAGASTRANDNIIATVADGVVYWVDGTGDEVLASDAQSGALLWNSGATIAGPVFAPPTVAGGHVYVGSWDGTLYAFAP